MYEIIFTGPTNRSSPFGLRPGKPNEHNKPNKPNELNEPDQPN